MDPLTLAIAGTAFQAVGAIRQASAESNAAKFNAQVAENNARIARQNAVENAARQRRENQRRLGAIRAGFGASGISLEGTPLDVLEDSAAEAELDALTIEHQGALEAAGFSSSAALSRTRARSAKQAGFVKAGTALLTGGTEISRQLKRTG